MAPEQIDGSSFTFFTYFGSGMAGRAYFGSGSAQHDAKKIHFSQFLFSTEASASDLRITQLGPVALSGMQALVQCPDDPSSLSQWEAALAFAMLLLFRILQHRKRVSHSICISCSSRSFC